MKVTNKNIEKLIKLDKEISKLKEDVSNRLNEVKRDFGDEDIEVKDEQKGGTRKIKQKDAWEEVWHLGESAEAYKALKEKYPKLFELSEKRKDKIKEMREFTIKEFGTDYSNMTFSEMIQLIIGIVKYVK
jgi:hypothetical protein